MPWNIFPNGQHMKINKNYKHKISNKPKHKPIDLSHQPCYEILTTTTHYFNFCVLGYNAISS